MRPAHTQNWTAGRRAAAVLYVLTLVAVVVGVDVLLFSHRFWARLIANVGIVVVFVLVYLTVLARSKHR